MENTYGERPPLGFRLRMELILDLFGYEISEKFKDPERFDIVIFKYPDDEASFYQKSDRTAGRGSGKLRMGKFTLMVPPLHWMTLSFRKMIGIMVQYSSGKTVISCLVITGMIRRIHVRGKTNSCDLTRLWGKLL